MKKIIYPIIFLITFGISSFTNSQDDTLQLYLTSIKLHLSVIEKSIQNQPEKKEYTRKEIYILNESGVELPAKIDNHTIIEVGDSMGTFIKYDETLHAIKLHPIVIENGEIVITISDFIISKRNNETMFSYSGGIQYYFAYNKVTKKYIKLKSKTISF